MVEIGPVEQSAIEYLFRLHTYLFNMLASNCCNIILYIAISILL